MTTESLTILKNSDRIQVLGRFLLRYGLALVIGWIGAMKFTAYEAAGVQPLVASSPLMSWMYSFLSVQGVSNLLGVIEISAAAMMAMRPFSAKVCALRISCTFRLRGISGKGYSVTRSRRLVAGRVTN